MARATTGKGLRSRFGFLGDIISELKKVMWPTREELVRLTLMVLGVCVVAAIVLGVMDYGFSELVRNVFIRE